MKLDLFVKNSECRGGFLVVDAFILLGIYYAPQKIRPFIFAKETWIFAVIAIFDVLIRQWVAGIGSSGKP